ncbi:MAG: hypothetical protein AAB969_03035 [Patescibacteria group bacterium]
MTVVDSKTWDYYDDVSLGKVNYRPYALAELKFDGTDTFSEPPTCTSWTYSSWSTCQSNGTQTRTVVSSSPSSCTGGNPILTQSCSYIAPICTSWTYSNWSVCTSGQQTRTVISSSPSNCAGGNPALSQSCESNESMVGESYSKNINRNFVKIDASPAVYWLSVDNKRYLFSNRNVFSSWFIDDFSGLRVIGQDEFDNIPIGENLTIKPENYLKFNNSNIIYYVKDNNNICKTNDQAKSIYLVQSSFEANYIVIGNCQSVGLN